MQAALRYDAVLPALTLLSSLGGPAIKWDSSDLEPRFQPPKVQPRGSDIDQGLNRLRKTATRTIP